MQKSSVIAIAACAVAIIAVTAACIIAANDNSGKSGNSSDSSEPSTYTISFFSDGGSYVEPITQTEGTDVKAPADPTKTGYTFSKWQLDGEDYTFTTMPSENITLRATWTADSYAISYEMNGGTNSDDNPSSYTIEDKITFEEPTREGYIFAGWYTDSDLTNETTGVSKGNTGDIKIYADWETSKVGQVMVFDMSGTNYSFFGITNSLSGTVTYCYLYYTYEKGYMMSYEETYTVSDYKGSSTYSDSDTYWSDENDDIAWTLQSGTQTISTIDGDVECEVWVGTKSSYTEKQYVGINNDLVYRIEYNSSSYGSSTSIVYTLKSIDTREVDTEYEVKVYCDEGVSVTGGGIQTAYSDVVLTAAVSDDTEFKGWYSESGTLLSKSASYTIDTLLHDTVVYALNTNDADYSADSTTVSIAPSAELTDVTWTFVDTETMTITSDTLNYTFGEPGSYPVKYTGRCSDGSSYYGYMDVFVDGSVTRTFTWSYDSKEFSTSLDIQYSDFLYYRNKDVSRSQSRDVADNLQFVTYNDNYVKKLAQDLIDLCTDNGIKSSLDQANFILAFTQYIEYQYDEYSMGEEEYWKYPLETLFDQNGDCEDTSILFCAIAKAAGYDCAMLLFDGHMAAGVSVDGASGNAFTSDDTTYYYCETTSAGYSVGDYIKTEKITWQGKQIAIDTRYTQEGILSIIPIV